MHACSWILYHTANHATLATRVSYIGVCILKSDDTEVTKPYAARHQYCFTSATASRTKTTGPVLLYSGESAASVRPQGWHTYQMYIPDQKMHVDTESSSPISTCMKSSQGRGRSCQERNSSLLLCLAHVPGTCSSKIT